MSATAVRTPADYESRLQQYYFERAEEGRAVRVGEKEVSEQAAIVARYTDLFSRAQVEALREAEQAASAEESERLYRLRKTCEAGVISAEIAEQEDALENAILGARVTFYGEEMPLRSAQARLAVLDSYSDREELGELERTESARFNPERRTLLEAREQLEADVTGDPDPVGRNEDEKGISLRELEGVLVAASDTTAAAFRRLRDLWFEKLLGPERDELPSNAHVHYLRRLSPLESTYTKERAVDICLATTLALGFDMTAIPNIRLDTEDRPQKNPRACVIASDPPDVVHLITRAQGGLSDYQAFLHEAGHALHYAGRPGQVPPELFVSGAIERGEIGSLRPFVAGQRGVEQELDADVRHRERAAAPDTARGQPGDRLTSQLLKRRGAVEGFVRLPVKPHAGIDVDVFRARRARADHRGEVRQHGAQHEGAVPAPPDRQDRVPEVVHPPGVATGAPRSPDRPRWSRRGRRDRA